MGRWAWHGVAALGLVLLAVPSGAQEPPAPAAKAEDRTVPLDDPRAKELDALLGRFGTAVRASDAKAAVACFDVARLLIEVKRHLPGGGRGLDVADPEFLAGFRDGFAQGFGEPDSLWRFERYQIRRVERGRDGGSLIATVRTWDRDEFAQTGRWWCHRTAVGWQIFDHDEFSVGIRISADTAVNLQPLMRGDLAGVERRVATTQALVAAVVLMNGGQSAEARTRLEALDPTLLPPFYQRMRHMLLASLALGEDDVEAAWPHLDAHDAVKDPDGADGDPMPVIQLLRGKACLLAGTLDRAEREARAYLARVGEDANGLQLLGAIHLAAGRAAEALAIFRRGLADDPGNADCFVGLAGTLAAGAKGELAAHAARVPRLAERFDLFAGPLLAAEDAEGLEALVGGLGKVAPGAPDVVFYGAHVRLLREAWGDAARLLREGRGRAPEAERAAWDHWWCVAMARDGKAVAAYAEAHDPPGAFASLVETLRERQEGTALAALCAAHRAKVPDDPGLPLWEADAAAFRSEHGKAVEILRPHIARYLADEDLGPDAESRWIRSLVGAKRFDEAMTEAKASTARDEDPWYELVVCAGRGDPAGSRAVLARITAGGADTQALCAVCYADDIIGPALRSPAFAKLRETYPPPPDAPVPAPGAGPAPAGAAGK